MQRCLPVITGFFWILFLACNEGGKSAGPADSLSVSPKQEVLQLPQPSADMPDSSREQLIEQLASREQFAKAIEQIDVLLQKNPGNPAWLYMKADALEKSTDTTDAINFYQQAIHAAGLFVEAEMRLANLYAETGNPKALEVINGLLKQPSALRLRSDLLMIQGIYYSKIKDSKKALATYNQIIKEDYSYLDAYLEKGLVYYDNNQFTEARNVFQLSTSIKNSFADGYYWMARCEEKLNKKEEALNNYKRALALDQNLAEAREGIGRLSK